MKSWSCSCSWTFGLGLRLSLEEKVLQFSRLLLPFLRAVSKAHHDILWDTTKPVCHSEDIVSENPLRAACASASLERVVNNGGYLLSHTDGSKVQCIACGKLPSLHSNNRGKQTVHGLKFHLVKCHKDIYILYTRKVESRQQGSAAKRRNWTRYWHLVTDWMKKEKKH